MKREAEFQTLFRHWLKAHPMPMSCAFELKQTTTDSLPFDAVQDHQVAALQACHHSTIGFLYKIPDDSRGVKPFDMMYFREARGFVVIRYPDFFCLIDVGKFIVERDVRSKRKSLTAAAARGIAYMVIDL